MRAGKKLKSRAGFTLAETLLAVMILMLVSSIVVSGMPVAKNAYEKVVLASNAEAFLSTAAQALRDELGTAWNVEYADGALTYFSADTGMRCKLYKGADGNLEIEEYSEDTVADQLLGNLKKEGSKTTRKLVYQDESDKTQFTVTATIGAPTYDAEKQEYSVTISGLCVNVKNGSSPLAAWKGTDAEGKETTDFVIPIFNQYVPTT